MLNWFGKHRAVVGYLILMVAVFFAISLAFVAITRNHDLGVQNRKLGLENRALTLKVDEKDNATRCRVVGLVGTFLDNSRRSANATLASPIATPEQKAVATKNLAEVAHALQVTEVALGHPTGKVCTIPPG